MARRRSSTASSSPEARSTSRRDVWHLSVREVAGLREEGQASGALGSLGRRVHDQLQQARRGQGDYQTERFVKTERQVLGLHVVVSGRLDGLWRDEEGGYVVEEYKSLNAGLARTSALELPPAYLEAVLWQCRLYEHLLALELGPDTRVRGRVVFADAWAGELFRLDVAYDPEACEAFLVRRLEQLVRQRLALVERASERKSWGEDLVFPFPATRPFQDEVMADVAGAVAQGANLALSAPTGIGKTVAALYPALRSALTQGYRVVHATAKVSQQTLALDTLERILGSEGPVLAVQLEAKERSCPLEEILCLPAHCPLLRNTMRSSLRRHAVEELGQRPVVRAQQVAEVARRHQLCPFLINLDLVYRADVVVADVNYLFHPSVRLADLHARDEASPEPRPWVAIVDEAHALYERARQFLSPEISERSIGELEAACEAGQTELLLQLARVLRELRSHVESLDRDSAGLEGDRASEQVVELGRGVWESVQAELEGLVWEYAAHVHSGGRRPAGLVPRRREGSRRVVDPLLEFWFQYAAFAEAAEDPGPGRVGVLRRNESGRSLQVLCLDPSSYLREQVRPFRSVIAMSATLEPLDVYVRGLGLDGGPVFQAAYPSPFPQENRLLVADVSVSTRYRSRSEDLGRVAERLVGLARARPGNHLAFLPSYAYLDELLPHLLKAQMQGGLSVLAARRATSAPEILDLLRRRAAERLVDSLLVCAVLGGSLSEGVDFPGDMAHTVAVVSPGLPRVSFERNLMVAYFDELEGAGFERAYLAVGLTAVVQAAGRLIRSESDVGVVALLGERFGEPKYLSLLPESWQRELVISQDCVAEARRFWRQRGFAPVQD